jgi:hypothetical protein
MQTQYSLVRSYRNNWSCVSRIGAILVLIAPVGAVAGESGGSFVSWRCPQRDGVNCLYLQLRLLGYNGSYEAVVGAVPGAPEQATLARLAQAARRLGFDLVPVKLTTAELFDLRFPTIILFEGLGIDSGRFHLLLGSSASMVYMVDGAHITRYRLLMSKDQFLRGWTGFALVPGPPNPWPGRAVGIAGGAVMVAGIYWLVARRARRGSNAPPCPISPFQPEVL